MQERDLDSVCRCDTCDIIIRHAGGYRRSEDTVMGTKYVKEEMTCSNCNSRVKKCTLSTFEQPFVWSGSSEQLEDTCILRKKRKARFGGCNVFYYIYTPFSIDRLIFFDIIRAQSEIGITTCIIDASFLFREMPLPNDIMDLAGEIWVLPDYCFAGIKGTLNCPPIAEHIIQAEISKWSQYQLYSFFPTVYLPQADLIEYWEKGSEDFFTKRYQEVYGDGFTYGFLDEEF